MDVNVTFEEASTLFNRNEDVCAIGEKADGTTIIEFCEEADRRIEQEASKQGISPEELVTRMVKSL
ncbi:MAG: hypothetical protein ACREF8_02880 [Chthoniobacterales bacterium]